MHQSLLKFKSYLYYQRKNQVKLAMDYLNQKNHTPKSKELILIEEKAEYRMQVILPENLWLGTWNC